MGLPVAVIRLFRLSGENIQKNWMTMIPERLLNMDMC